MVENDSILFHFIFKFYSQKPTDISGIARISNRSKLFIDIPLERVKDDNYIGFMGHVSNEKDVKKLNNIIESENPIISIEGGSDRLWFGLHQGDKEMIRSTIKLFFEIWKLKNPTFNPDISLQNNSIVQHTEKVNKESHPDVYNICGEFVAYFPDKPQVDQSSYLKKKENSVLLSRGEAVRFHI